YSARLSRCTTYLPGVAFPSQARSSDAESQLVNAAYSASAGCGVPCGGIARTASLRSTRSQVAACGIGSVRLAVSRLTGLLAGVCTRLLWQGPAACLARR